MTLMLMSASTSRPDRCVRTMEIMADPIVEVSPSDIVKRRTAARPSMALTRAAALKPVKHYRFGQLGGRGWPNRRSQHCSLAHGRQQNDDETDGGVCKAVHA